MTIVVGGAGMARLSGERRAGKTLGMTASSPPGLLFVHGWGFGTEVWAGLGLAGAQVDLGYGFTPRSDAGEQRVIGVGHSFGGLWLLRHLETRLAGLVLINGFARFTAAPDWPHGRPGRVMERMRRAFAVRPEDVLADFRARCGAPPWEGRCDMSALGADLDALAEWDARVMLASLGIPCLCLAAADDPLVDLAASRATAALCNADCVVAPEGGHLLPLTRPAWCAAQIAAFCA